MTKKEKPLPKPQTSAFGRKREFEDSEGKGPLIADKMVMAMAEGKLEEFLKQEIPDSEHARKLAMMLMGMTGMLPPEAVLSKTEKDFSPSESTEAISQEKSVPSSQPPEDVVNAIRSGDVKGLVGLLEREYRKRMPDAASGVSEENASRFIEQPAIEKDVIDQLIKIASDNNLTPDWIMLRALKVYVQEYHRTGRL